jgi:hypothetical protein
MRRQSNHLRYLSAAGVLALGTACAANVYLKPPSYRGPDTAQLRQLADRVTAAPPVEAAPLYVPPARHSYAAVVTPPASPRKPASQPSTQSHPAPAPAAPAESKPTPEAAVKQIALMGVTQQGDAPTAWLVDIATHERETVATGESAFGFLVKEIGSESVLLAQDGEVFTVHMGDKEIPVVEPEPTPVTTPVANQDNANGQGRWGRRGFGGGGGGNWAGRWSGGGGSNWSGGGGNRNWSRGGNNSGSFSRPTFSGNFGGFGGFGGQNFNQSNNRNSSLNRPTANPQEARRHGTRLIGGADPLPTPATIRNPQTARRRGTNSGRAFGADPNWRY